MNSNDNSEVNKLDIKVEKLDDKITTLDTRVTVLEMQVGRLTSHVESELGLARTDLARLEERLFGKDDSIESGRIGELIKSNRSNSEEISKILLKFAYGAGFVACVMLVLELYKTFR